MCCVRVFIVVNIVRLTIRIRLGFYFCVRRFVNRNSWCGSGSRSDLVAIHELLQQLWSSERSDRHTKKCEYLRELYTRWNASGPRIATTSISRLSFTTRAGLLRSRRQRLLLRRAACLSREARLTRCGPLVSSSNLKEQVQKHLSDS